MYEIISSIIGAPAEANATVVAACGVAVVVLTCVIIDLVVDIFSGFFRG